MSRVKWKNPYVQNSLIKTINTNSIMKNEIKTFSRSSVIIPKFVNAVFEIYNGKTFLKLKITENMVGHKLGEFLSTRKKFIYKKKKK